METQVPGTVRAAVRWWFAALAAGLFEMAVVVAGFTGSYAELATGVGIRLAIYAAVVWVVFRMRNGRSARVRNLARFTLAVMLGGIGTVSLVYEPVGWLAAGNSWWDALTGADVLFVLTAASRAAHLVAVAAATVLMFLPASNRYFRAGAATADTAAAARP